MVVVVVVGWLCEYSFGGDQQDPRDVEVITLSLGTVQYREEFVPLR